jgi:dTDP-4-amino-4,6-dideoxygalactose transaminase
MDFALLKRAAVGQVNSKLSVGRSRSERLSPEVPSLPMHPYLEPAQQDRVIDAIVKSMRSRHVP